MERGCGFSAPVAGMKGKRRNEAENVWMRRERRKRGDPTRPKNGKCN